MNLQSIVTGLICLFTSSLFAQQQLNAKFANVAPEDFKSQAYSIDSNANAIVIADIGSTKFIGNNKGNFSLEFNKFRRVYIVNKNGYDAASVEISIYTDGDREEQLKNLKAITYNLENGKIVETKLDTKSAVFKEKINK